MRIPIEDIRANKDLLYGMDCVRIWTGQGGLYWKENYCGYTNSKAEAGVFPAHEAWKHVGHCGEEKHEHLEPVDAIEDMHEYLQGAKGLLMAVRMELDGCFCEDNGPECDRCLELRRILEFFEEKS